MSLKEEFKRISKQARDELMPYIYILKFDCSIGTMTILCLSIGVKRCQVR